MSIVVGGGEMVSPAEPIKDKDGEPIHPNEGYRRAKRNVLFWGAATTLLAVGTSSTDTAVEINALVRYLSFKHGLLVFASLLVLVFMMFGYWRADRQLVARHSGFALAHRMDELGVTVQRMINDMRATERIATSHLESLKQQGLAIREAKRKAIEHITRSPKIHPAMAEDMMASDDGIREWKIQPPQLKGVASVEFLKEHGRNSTNKELLDIAIHANESVAQAASTWMQDLLVEWLHIQQNAEKVFLDALPGNDASELAMKTVNSKFDELKDLPAQLSGFSTKIGVGERLWFWLYDRLPVVIVALLGVVSALWHLYDSSSLAKATAFWF